MGNGGVSANNLLLALPIHLNCLCSGLQSTGDPYLPSRDPEVLCQEPNQFRICFAVDRRGRETHLERTFVLTYYLAS